MKTIGYCFFTGRILVRFLFAFCLSGSLTQGATLLVYNNNNAGPGSLRQIISDHNALGGSNTIVFSNVVSGTIVLTSGQLTLTASANIIGPGAGALTVSGNDASRVFQISSNINVTLSGLTIAHGLASDSLGGGGILNQATLLTLSNCVITLAGSSVRAGGIVNRKDITMIGCTVSACSGPSGGLYNAVGAYAYIGDCAFLNNPTGGGNGGGIANDGSIDGYNCTFYGNSTGGSGGAIWSTGFLTLIHCTIVANSAGPLGGGGGIASYSHPAVLQSCVVAGNTSGPQPDIYGLFDSFDYNFIGATNGGSGFGALGDQLGKTNSLLNPQLGPLQNNGGPTFTLAPLPGSPLIDQAISGGYVSDQRGRVRPFDNSGVPNASLGDGSDIGAVEVGATTLLVTNTNDNGVGSLRAATLTGGDPGDVIAFASNVVGSIMLTSGPVAVQRDLTISGPGAGVLRLSGNNASDVIEVISGKAAISGLTIADGRQLGSAGGFELNGGLARGGGIFNQTTLALNDCVISNCVAQGGQGGATDSGFAGGGGNGQGGGILNIGTLTMTNCYLVANAANGGAGGIATSGGFDGSGGQGYGGGIYSSGPLTLVRCAVANNIASGAPGGGGAGSGSGGGLYNDADVTLLTCTVASNSASGSGFDFGGGIFDNGTSVTIRGSTIAGNQADFGGGLSLSAVAVCSDTILAYNGAGSGPDCSGTINSGDYNLIQNTAGATITGTTTHNLTGQNPLLGALADNGGLSATLAPLAGSPVIDKGKNSGPATDQRGAPRPFDFASTANAAGGDGSDIGAFESGSPQLAIQNTGSAVMLSWPSYYGGVTVQSVTNVVLSSAWTTVAGTPVVSGNQYLFTNSPITGNKFYRLKGN